MIRTLVCAVGVAIFSIGAGQAQGITPTPYNIVSEDVSEQRRIAAVRIERRLDDADLLQVAHSVLARTKQAYGRTQINFYLPAMTLNQGPWATVTFAPDTKIVVFGLSRADEDLFLAEQRADRRPMLGAWLTSPPAAPGRLAIYSDHGKIYAEWRLRGGQRTVDEVQDSLTKAGRRFDVQGAGYYVLTRTGELEIWDKSTLIATAERIRPEHLALPSAVALGSKSQASVAHVAHVQPDVRPPAPAQPEPKTAPSVPAASSAGLAPAIPPPAISDPVAPTVAPTVASTDPEPVQPAAKATKIAKTHTRTKTVQTTHTVAQVKSAAKSKTMTPGEVMTAKLAGRL